MISALVRSGGDSSPRCGAWNGNGETIVPCGRCRQLLFEFAGQTCW